ncbi:MAG: aminotransferase class IV [Ignavibacteriales bacterium]|nr:aminotransferase class IV [Ignavibacteriales bacterium]
MSRLFESIKVFDRKLYDIEYHNARMNKTRHELFNSHDEIDLVEVIKIPADLSHNLYKCRVIYTDGIINIVFHPYIMKPVTDLKVVYDDSILYKYKFEDREEFLKHLDNVEEREILIVKNRLITDTSYSNIVFSDNEKFITPATPLLKGTKREKLLNIGKIIEGEIRLTDLHKFKYAYLINAMIDLEDNVRVPINKILY